MLTAIASLTPLFSWLKGAPPGTYPSSRRQKKRFFGLVACFWHCFGDVWHNLWQWPLRTQQLCFADWRALARDLPKQQLAKKITKSSNTEHRVGFLTGGRKQSFCDLSKRNSRCNWRRSLPELQLPHANQIAVHHHGLLTWKDFLELDFPPPCSVKVRKNVQHIYKVRRLHLIVVDLWRPWRYNAKSAKQTIGLEWKRQCTMC